MLVLGTFKEFHMSLVPILGSRLSFWPVQGRQNISFGIENGVKLVYKARIITLGHTRLVRSLLLVLIQEASIYTRPTLVVVYGGFYHDFTKDIFFALECGGCNEYLVIAPICHGHFSWSGFTFGALSNISRFEQNMYMLRSIVSSFLFTSNKFVFNLLDEFK